MASTVKNHELRQPPELRPVPAPARVTKVFIPLITPYLYGMERAVIELFDALRPQVEPYFLQSNRIFQQKLPIVEEMKRRGFSIRLLPDRTDWERLARPRSVKHFVQMTIAAIRCNVAILKGSTRERCALCSGNQYGGIFVTGSDVLPPDRSTSDPPLS